MTPKPTQLQTIKAELLKGNAIDSVQAFERHHITRLSSIIERLRKKGMAIQSTRQKNSSLVNYSLARSD
ncbi:MAG: helix-turn-helix domain-containing protein [Methylococcaceae bacterium]|nr:helix-turn-helix domain-containing protein [Methylococcaceae bacterium]